jgi:hypothetical protein
MMRLLHYAAEPLGEIRDAAEQPPAHFKPVGLWVSVEGPDDWPSWCKGEDFGLERLRYAHEIGLRSEAKILHLKNARDIDSMSRYRTRNPAYAGLSYHSLDWRPVAEEYDGIIIAPYNWSRRLHQQTAWYYAWDCASGCIWRSRAVERVTLLADAA